MKTMDWNDSRTRLIPLSVGMPFGPASSIPCTVAFGSWKASRESSLGNAMPYLTSPSS